MLYAKHWKQIIVGKCSLRWLVHRKLWVVLKSHDALHLLDGKKNGLQGIWTSTRTRPKFMRKKSGKSSSNFVKTCPKELLGQKVTQRKQSLILTNTCLISWFSLGRIFDKDGNLNDWWSLRSFFGFSTRATCLAKQYSQFEVYGQKVYFSGILPQFQCFPPNVGILYYIMRLFVSFL